MLGSDAAVLPVVEIARLRALPIFSPLGAPELEALARSLERVEAPAGATIIREGEAGDRFYLDKGVFVSAVTGHHPSARAADELVHSRLERATTAP